jgi:hypothetical protein
MAIIRRTLSREQDRIRTGDGHEMLRKDAGGLPIDWSTPSD